LIYWNREEKISKTTEDTKGTERKKEAGRQEEQNKVIRSVFRGDHFLLRLKRIK
jgi:hypothetical protein